MASSPNRGPQICRMHIQVHNYFRRHNRDIRGEISAFYLFIYLITSCGNSSILPSSGFQKSAGIVERLATQFLLLLVSSHRCQVWRHKLHAVMKSCRRTLSRCNKAPSGSVSKGMSQHQTSIDIVFNTLRGRNRLRRDERQSSSALRIICGKSVQQTLTSFGIVF